MTEHHPLTARYLTATREHLGWDARLDADGDIVVERDKITYVIVVEDRDPAWVDVVLSFPRQVPLTSHARLLLAHGRTHDIKGVKVRLEENGALLRFGQLVAGPDRLPTIDFLVGVLPRMVSALRHTAATLIDEFERESSLRSATDEEGVA